jgi:hypothetical protein
VAASHPGWSDSATLTVNNPNNSKEMYFMVVLEIILDLLMMAFQLY